MKPLSTQYCTSSGTVIILWGNCQAIVSLASRVVKVKFIEMVWYTTIANGIKLFTRMVDKIEDHKS